MRLTQPVRVFQNFSSEHEESHLIRKHSLVPRLFVEECFKISVQFRVFRYTYNYAHAHIDDVRMCIYIEKSRQPVLVLKNISSEHEQSHLPRKHTQP